MVNISELPLNSVLVRCRIRTIAVENRTVRSYVNYSSRGWDEIKEQ